ncbi:uncharacterized protein isoform X2 [Choristoneura fumiferana]|uniref:uncharacterized protein isoform X2 n=1 Tax=Choristoneura fumiferana TaxID=7141 RepID=UPI003D15CFA9
MSSHSENNFLSEEGPVQPLVTDRSAIVPPVLDLSTSQPGNSQPQATEDTALHVAVEDQDIAAIADLMKLGASPAALDANGLTPMHLCIVKKYIEPLTILLTYEGSADVLDASGLSVLYVAILHIWREGVSAALAAGARVTVEGLAFIPEDVITQRYPQAMMSKFGSKFEMFYIYLRRVRYFLTLESWVKMTCLTLGAVVPVAESVTMQPYWHRHAASGALLLTWLQAMFLVSRFPKWGYYVLIFGKVTINIFKILMTSICLVIGFSFCFMIEFQWTPPFDEPFAAFVKTVVMMSSEFDYEDLFGSDHASKLQDTKTVIRLVFVVFVVFVAIILMNFMIGVAVSDINDLQMAGSIKRLEKQVELLSSLEVLVNNRLIANAYSKRFGEKKYHMKISNYVGSQSKWCAALSADYDFYYLDLPEALHAAIIDIAWQKEQRDEKNGIVMTNKYKLNALYDAVVDRPIVTNEVFNIEEGNKAKKLREGQSRLNIEIKSLKDGLSVVNNDVKNTMMKVNKISSDITTIKEMLASFAFAKSSENIRTS